MKASKVERQKRLIAMISMDPGLLIRDLAKEMQVSRETVRRDLDELSKEGRLHRRYGGATFAPIGLEMNFSNRSEFLVCERRSIAQLAVRQIQDNEVIMLGSGATCLHFAHEVVAQQRKVTVITNSISAATVLGKGENTRTLVAPGEYDDAEGFLWGHETTDFVSKFHADVLVFSVDGLSSAGAMEIDSRTGWILRRMMSVARRKMLLVDHSKHHQKSLELVCPLTSIDMLVTDLPPDEALAHHLDNAGVIVKCVEKQGGNDAELPST